jgi:hypothetical protein
VLLIRRRRRLRCLSLQAQHRTASSWLPPPHSETTTMVESFPADLEVSRAPARPSEKLFHSFSRGKVSSPDVTVAEGDSLRVAILRMTLTMMPFLGHHPADGGVAACGGLGASDSFRAFAAKGRRRNAIPSPENDPEG